MLHAVTKRVIVKLYSQLGHFGPALIKQIQKKVKQPKSWQHDSRIKWSHDVILRRKIVTLYLCTETVTISPREHLIFRISRDSDFFVQKNCDLSFEIFICIDIFSLLKRSSDSFVELTDLVHKGEKQGIFTSKMPASIQQVVREENLCFMKNRDVYDIDYFRFVKKLVTKASVSAPTLFTLIKYRFVNFVHHAEMATVPSLIL